MSSTLPPVSIGIPFFNAERFLLDSIRSVFAQTHQDWELILMDDGSTDRSLEIAQSVNDPRVRVYSDGANKKLAARLNEIRDLASYEFIARMDADDLMARERIEKQLKFLLAHPNVDLVTTGVCSISDESMPYGIRVTAREHVLTPYRVLSGSHGIVHAAILGRRDWFFRNPYDPSDYRGQDYRLWIRASRSGDLSVGFLREPLYFYREEGSMSPQKMLTAQKRRRGSIMKNGPFMIGGVQTLKLIGSSFLKSAVIWCAALFGVSKYIVRARSPIADPDEMKATQDEIRRSSLVCVPRNL